MKTLQDVRGEHAPRYTRKRLGHGAVSGRPLFASHVTCSCGWTSHVNQSKRDAERDWKDHTRDVWKQLRNPHATGPARDGAQGTDAPGGGETHDEARHAYQRWLQVQEQVKPCPCCGRKAFWRQGDKAQRKPDMVQCGGCGLLMQCTIEPGSALSRWNQRT